MIRNLKTISLIFMLYAASTQASLSAYFPQDSIGIEKKDGKNFILHKVDAKETLFSISRKYNVHVNELKGANPEAASGLNLGQVIRIPYTPKSVNTTEQSAIASNGRHVVEAKETLYSISKKYKVSVDELKATNAGLDKGLSVGQELIIPGKQVAVAKEEKAKEKEEVKAEKAEEKKEEPQENLEEKEVATTVKKTSSTLSAPNNGYKKVNESGSAEVMDNNPDNLSYLALHKTASVGTIIQVRNEDNDQKIFVRVIGKLNTIAGDKTILKLSPKAMERLGSKGEKIPVSISYIP